jgi:hypothetical protein
VQAVLAAVGIKAPDRKPKEKSVSFLAIGQRFDKFVHMVPTSVFPFCVAEYLELVSEARNSPLAHWADPLISPHSCCVFVAAALVSTRQENCIALLVQAYDALLFDINLSALLHTCPT